jgi:uncharacterized damage-inducible protein DinB
MPMIDSRYVQTMAAYNAWQNASLVAAADGLADAERRADKGAFFGSIHATLSHLVWADRLWLARFTGSAPPRARSIAASVAECEDWDRLKREREALDREIVSWAAGLGGADLEGDLTWHSGSLGRDVSRPLWLLVAHFFNHQTHHRGQVHALLTAFGAKPEDTDLCFMPGGER